MKPLSSSDEVDPKQFRRSILLTRKRRFHMIILKLTGLCSIGAGSIAAVLASELGPDLALAILSMFF
jgi:hypothetical protein